MRGYKEGKEEGQQMGMRNGGEAVEGQAGTAANNTLVSVANTPRCLPIGTPFRLCAGLSLSTAAALGSQANNPRFINSCRQHAARPFTPELHV